MMVPHSSTKKCVVDILLEVIHRVPDDGCALQERRAGQKSVLAVRVGGGGETMESSGTGGGGGVIT